MRDGVAVNSFTEFVREVEPRLKRALVAAFGREVGMDALAEALAYGWEKLGPCVGNGKSGGYRPARAINKLLNTSLRFANARCVMHWPPPVSATAADLRPCRCDHLPRPRLRTIGIAV